MLGAVWEPWQARDQEHQTRSLRDDQKLNRKGQRAPHEEENTYMNDQDITENKGQ